MAQTNHAQLLSGPGLGDEGKSDTHKFHPDPRDGKSQQKRVEKNGNAWRPWVAPTAPAAAL